MTEQTKPNYGDAALNLPPDWSRTRIAGDPAFILTTVGHENGVADARLTDDPSKAHQFRWIDPADQNQLSLARTRHYKYCNKNAGWEKRDELWEYDGEGFIVLNGQKLMARDGDYYYAEIEAEKERKEAEKNRRSVTQEEERAVRALESRGIVVEDERGRPLKPLSQKQKRA